ncbi:hypothetical protein A2160_01085 [Candidatus Beckwithbacteria bacterium RBG_13_42_9]|uniref:Uncharacterized protein n=1 Tax=Candidatus Beckwithbacteria bacterium RBG_13_42_9 TaxID=1797457 RepID=A0A1F5E3H9_9BACT|nr:MAG: hypothetical protein A2160_01085 [Candidatus Beckwithbacteria bacterium RBG_13_42_9]
MIVSQDKADKSEKTPLVAIYQEKPDLRKKELPLVNLQVTNPVTYLKNWWSRVMGKEGIDLSFKIHPITAIILTIIIATLGFGMGHFVFTSEKPYVKLVTTPSPSPQPSLNLWRETAFSGTLKFSNNKYYLITTSSEAIMLAVPENVDLSGLVGRRIFATGQFNDQSRLLKVAEAANLELLPKKIEPVPVISPLPTPSAEPLPTPSEEPLPSQTPSPEPSL